MLPMVLDIFHKYLNNSSLIQFYCHNIIDLATFLVNTESHFPIMKNSTHTVILKVKNAILNFKF